MAVLSSIFMLVIALLSLLFSASLYELPPPILTWQLTERVSLAWHRFQRKSKIPKAERRSFNLRHDRALEIGLAGALFLLWPRTLPYLLTPDLTDPTASRRNRIHPLPTHR